MKSLMILRRTKSCPPAALDKMISNSLIIKPKPLSICIRNIYIHSLHCHTLHRVNFCYKQWNGTVSLLEQWTRLAKGQVARCCCRLGDRQVAEEKGWGDPPWDICWGKGSIAPGADVLGCAHSPSCKILPFGAAGDPSSLLQNCVCFPSP